MSDIIINITSFDDPFSFFCIVGKDMNSSILTNDKQPNVLLKKSAMLDVDHGQYVSVWHNGMWTRGVITMESQVLIWLVDCGSYLRPTGSTFYVDLPSQFRKIPTKVFQASIHGVLPVDKVLSDDCKIEDAVAYKWNKGAIEKGQKLIKSASLIHFVPVALLSTKANDIVLGDLYLDIPGEGTINFLDEMEMWPVFLKRDPKGYFEHLSTLYSLSRRKHHACILKPQITGKMELPSLTLNSSFSDYCSIVENSPKFILEPELDGDSYVGSTVVDRVVHKKKHKLTPEEINMYSNMYVNVCGREYNVLNVIVNKTRDLTMCERYKNYDRKSVGRGTRSKSIDHFDM